MYRSHSVRGISGMYLLISLCDSMTGVCKASGLKHSMAFRVFAWFLIKTVQKFDLCPALIGTPWVPKRPAASPYWRTNPLVPWCTVCSPPTGRHTG